MVEPRNHVHIIGIGSGSPDHLTSAAEDTLVRCDYVVAAAKGPDDPLLGVRRRLCERYGVELVVVPDPERDRAAAHVEKQADYVGAVRDWHAARVAAYAEVLAARPGVAGFLVWGDPSLYDSTIRVVSALGLPYDVVPGLAAPQLLAAAHGIVLHPIGRPLLITTGRRLLADVASGADDVVVMLDGGLTCLELEDLGAWDIWWGANLGTASEVLEHGRLDEVAHGLRQSRAAVAAAAGWVMDTYLLRRR